MDLEGKTDRELLLLTVQRLEFLEGAVTKLTATVQETRDEQNGQLEKMAERLTSLEHWRTGLAVVLGLWGAAWPFLIYEFRQWFLERFGFIVGG